MDDAVRPSDVVETAAASELVRVLLECRRELLCAIALTQEVIRDGATLRWLGDSAIAIDSHTSLGETAHEHGHARG